MSYDGPQSGLWKNKHKKGDNHPDYKGKVQVDRTTLQSMVDQLKSGEKFAEVEVAAWKKVSGSGDTFLSLRADTPYRFKTERSRAPAPRVRQEPEQTELDDEIPF